MPPEETGDRVRETAAAYSAAPPPAQLIDLLYREEILQARRMPPEEKLLAGERLFEWACEITLAGIRDQFPEYSEAQCRSALARRLALRRKLEELT
jgi:hypothetical protein